MRPTTTRVVLIHPQLAEAVRLRQLLEALGSFSARAFTTPETGLAYARDYPVDLALVFKEFDSMLTAELVARLRVLHPAIKLIVLAASEEDARAMGAQVGLPLPVVGRSMKPVLDALFPRKNTGPLRPVPMMPPPEHPETTLPPISTAENEELLDRLSAEEPEVVPPEQGGTLREPVSSLLSLDILLQSQHASVIELSEPSAEPLASTPVPFDRLDADLLSEDDHSPSQPLPAAGMAEAEAGHSFDEVAIDALPLAPPIITDAPEAAEVFDALQRRFAEIENPAPEDDLDLLDETPEPFSESISQPMAITDADEDSDAYDSQEYDSGRYESEEFEITPPPQVLRKPLPPGTVLPGTRIPPDQAPPTPITDAQRPAAPVVAARVTRHDDDAAHRALEQVASATGATATALILARGNTVVAHAGDMPSAEIEELRAVVEDDWQMQGTGSRMRYVTLPSSGQEYVLFTRRALDEMTLSLLFNSDQQLTAIRKQSAQVAQHLTEISTAEEPDASGLTLASVTLIWVVRDAAKPLTAVSAQRIVAMLDRDLTQQGWAIHSLNVHSEYVYLFCDAPADQNVPELVRLLHALSAQAAYPEASETEAASLWADAYLAVMPGRELSADEVRRFVGFSRMRATPADSTSHDLNEDKS